MKFYKFFLCVLSTFGVVVSAEANQLEVIGDIDITKDEIYSGNLGTGTAGYGIFAEGTSGVINTNGFDITSSGNINGINIGANGTIEIKGNGNNTLNVSNNAGSGIFIPTASGSLTITNMNIVGNNNVGGDYTAGIYNYGTVYIKGDGTQKMQLNGNSEDLANDDGSGNYTRGYGMSSRGTMTIEGMNIEVSDNQRYGIATVSSRGSTSITGSTDVRNTIVAKGNGQNYYGVAADPNITTTSVLFATELSANLTVKHMDIYNYDSGGFNVTSSSTVTLEDVNLYNITDGDYYTFKINRNSEVYVSDSRLYNESEKLLMANFEGAGTATLNVSNSYVNGSVLTGGLTASLLNFTNTDWDMRASSNVTELSVSGGNINLSGKDYNTLNVMILNLDDTNIHLNTFFDGDGDTTDKIVVNGILSGNATLHVTSTGTDGSSSSGNGIMVVDATAAEVNSAVFKLYGDVVDSDFWEYELHQADDANWYLKSNGNISNTARVIANLPAVQLSIVKTGMNELNRRLGELRNNSPYVKHGTWVRSYAKNLKVDDTVDTKMNLYGIEAGYDYQFFADCYNKGYLGIMAGYLYADDIRTRNIRTVDGNGQANVPSVGIYGTWLNRDGWFADAAVRSFWVNQNSRTHTSQGNIVSVDADRQYTALSLELGRQVKFYQSVIVEPKIEVQYIYGGSKNYRTNNAGTIHYDDSSAFSTKASLMLGYNKKLINGTIVEPYVQGGVIQEWDGRTDIRYNSVRYKSDISGTSVELGGGLNARLDNHWNLYSQLMYETGSVVTAVSGNIGIRYSW